MAATGVIAWIAMALVRACKSISPLLSRVSRILLSGSYRLGDVPSENGDMAYVLMCAGAAFLGAAILLTPGDVVNARSFIADGLLVVGAGLVLLGKRLRRRRPTARSVPG